MLFLWLRFQKLDIFIYWAICFCFKKFKRNWTLVLAEEWNSSLGKLGGEEKRPRKFDRTHWGDSQWDFFRQSLPNFQVLQGSFQSKSCFSSLGGGSTPVSFSSEWENEGRGGVLHSILLSAVLAFSEKCCVKLERSPRGCPRAETGRGWEPFWELVWFGGCGGNKIDR